ncbi:MAG TPA: hypothetical protein VFR84_06470 [Candidatus Angelobacter sp.]|nr:hypothetical protein [Candidatus Angelobacter sp.]
MPKKGSKKKKAAKRSSPVKKAKLTLQTSTPVPQDAASQAASDRFVKDLLVRGEAAEPTPEGKLPLRATHAITRKNPDGTAQVERVRFKAF